MPTEWKTAYHYRHGGEVCRECVHHWFGDPGGRCGNPSIIRHENKSVAVLAWGVCDLYEKCDETEDAK